MGSSFDRLPAELRHFIWTLTLGEHGDAPTMVPFRTARPWLLEEEDDDDELLMGGDDADEFMSDEQFEEIRLLALRQVAGQNENEDTAGPVPPAPTTLPSNGVITIADDDVDDGAGEGDGQDDATNEAPIGDEGENDDDDDDEEDEEVEESEDEFQGSLDTDEGEFEPGNPYGQERAWDDEVVIAVYIPPLLLVNREARSVTLNWLKKHDIQLNRNTISKGEINTGFAPNKDGLPPYTRKYDPERDHLYVDRRYWRRFCDRLQMPHMMAPDDNDDADEEEDPVHDIGETIKHLALPAFTMYQSVGVVGNILEFLPNIQQIACIWGDLPHKEWKPRIVYETVQRDGKPMTQVTNVLLPRWDHAQISEKLSQEEHDRRNDDTERIKAEREKDRQERQEKKDQAEKNGRTNEEDEEDDDEDEDDDDEEEEEGTGPIVTMCIRDPSDDTKVFYERGYLSNWLDEIYNELSICELPEHVTDEYDGSVTLPIVPCNAVLRQ
ncbi:uncharacterized protein LMH87_008632 [Akanthomyces muscarius]|uniref:Uncharacterized protein n=1 Tax=Akanthomyces muscarius TaxID=2231603 RepID=A0A9W8QIF3_AKAMU|nr:uncharacterized protein LMH87_008632 [Akanthomyces muscarius]KAJ4158088.1 hypothetical protein LMH87_008632 [Akanthomyces muscarius]